MEDVIKRAKQQEKIITLKDIYIAALKGELDKSWIERQIVEAEKELKEGDLQ